MLNLKTLATAAALSIGLGSAASAVTLIVDSSFPIEAPYVGEINCTMDACEGLVGTGPTDWDADAAKLFDLGNSGDATELAWVNSVTGENFLSGTKTNSPTTSFQTMAEYILLKIGSLTTLIKNTYGTMTLTVSYNDLGGRIGEGGGGLSHITEFGVAPIPLPAAGFLMLGALGALGVAARRRKA